MLSRNGLDCSLAMAKSRYLRPEDLSYKLGTTIARLDLKTVSVRWTLDDNEMQFLFEM
jgi:hypothetical protein